MQSLFEVIYEDTDLLAVHKPADLVCHPTKGDEYSSLISRARVYLRSKATRSLPESSPAATGSPLAHLIHRLDRETSGVVLLAKNAVAARELGTVWETRAVRKEYLALVHGWVSADAGIIDAPLGKDHASPVAIKDCVRPDGTPARTEFVVEQRFTRRVAGTLEPLPFSVLRVLPLTGRKHQIRLHLAHLGHPLVGDKIYGGDPDLYLALVEKRLTAEQQTRLILPQHALHAGRLQFAWRGRDYDFTTPPEAAFREFMSVGNLSAGVIP